VLAAALVAALGAGAPAEAGHTDGKVLILAQPLARTDAVWMAQAKGFFKEEKLEVTVRWMSSGNDALRTFQDGKEGKPGFGDFVIVNELLAVNLWQTTDGSFAVIAALARDAEGYVAIARTEVATPQALKGKAVGTQVGSTSAWFLSEYLRAHGMSERDVALKPVGPDAILTWDVDRRDVTAFFVREPYGTRALTAHGSRVHRLATAKGYMSGYLLIGTWNTYLRDHPGVAERLLRALEKGRRYAEEHRAEVIQFAREMFSVEDAAPVEADYSSNERVVGLDHVMLDDFDKLARWMKEAGLATRTFDGTSFFDAGPLREALPERLPPEFRR
jgi:ABC-type nitrate/sulfonate/bicarbonate transport system substrate-binding protein